MLIETGIYKILQCIEISHSLMSQIENLSNNENCIIKALAIKNDQKFVLYLIDSELLGKDSKIEIINILKFPILKRDDFRIVKKKDYSHSVTLIKKLLENV